MVLSEVETGSPHYGVRKASGSIVNGAFTFIILKVLHIAMRNHRNFVPARDKATVNSMTEYL
jgi:hypothetical protein